MNIFDLASVIYFLLIWMALEPLLSTGWPNTQKNLLYNMECIRSHWMREVLTRDKNFIGDAAILGHTINSASFFGSANLIVIVGVSSALFISPEARTGQSVAAIILSDDTLWLFQCKILLFMATLSRGLSDFIWAVRQINYCLAAIGASPSIDEQRDVESWINALTQVVNPALRSFGRGVRCYYFTVAAASWFLGPMAFALMTTTAVALLVWRQTCSDFAKAISGVNKLLGSCRTDP